MKLVKRSYWKCCDTSSEVHLLLILRIPKKGTEHMEEWVDFLEWGAYCFYLITSKRPASYKHPPTPPIKTQKQNKKPWRAQEKGLIIISLPAYNLSINCLWYIDTFVTIFYKFASEWNWWNMNKLDSLCCFPHINSWSGCVGSFSNGVVDTNAPTVNF